MSAPNLTLWLDGELRSTANPQVNLLDQALHYGSGVFEGIRAYDTAHGPAIFRLPEHMDRLQRGLAHFGHQADLEAMCAAMPGLLATNGLSDAYLRPIAWLGGNGLSLDVEHMQLRQCVAALPWTSHLGETAKAGLKLMTSSYRRNSSDSMPPLKMCGGYVNSLLAKLEATRKGYDEALFLDGKWVCEASAENVFFAKDGKLTAITHKDMLPGITRDSLIAISGAESRAATFAELYDADEIFLCGTSAEVTPVTLLDDRELPIGPITKALAATYQDIVHGRDTTFAHWLTLAGEKRRGAA
ncbi:MAG: branched chain amino acid aminotransferase [Deltaproteobacteria bacterium]|nr:MAG: branched chain amino acid aminotransferase [Deltaproteobacteria bacterium]